ncbi:MAG: hypothetical protein GY943_34745, partial [Chloroflexi bacterium]|nr:hypothetical protein [Chloroflexota bacterium]
DNVDPVVTFTGQHIGSGTAAQTEYTFTFSDFLLNPDSFEHPCADGDVISMAYSGTNTPRDGQFYEASATCRVLGHGTGSETATACDLAGSCTTETVTMNAPANEGNLVITAPTHNDVISTTLPVAIEGGAFAPDGIEDVVVSVDNAFVASLAMGGVIVDSTWVVDWFPTGPGVYEITAVMTDTLNNVFTDTVDVFLTGYVLDVAMTGSGSGTVNSDPAGISCGADCMETFAPSRAVTLTAVADTGSV